MHCIECGKEFSVVKARIKIGWGKFCSHKCHGIYRSKHSLGPSNPNWKGGRFKEICEICGKEFLVVPSAKNLRKLCSEKCRAINHSGKMGGINNPNWKGGVTILSHSIRTSFQYGYWRQQVLMRDGFKCKKCGAAGGDLNAHHIKHFHVLLKEAQRFLPLFNGSDAIMAYSPMWDVNNGIALCDTCHKMEHSK